MPRLFLIILFCIMWFLGIAAHAQIMVNGSLGDWEGIPALPVEPRDVGHDSVYGMVREVRAAADAYCLYVLLEFQAARPFANPQEPRQLAPGYFDDFSYLEIDANGDGKWDYRTQM